MVLEHIGYLVDNFEFRLFIVLFHGGFLMKMFKNMALALMLLGAGSVSAMDVVTALEAVRSAAFVVADGEVAALNVALTAIAGDMDNVETEAAICDVLDAKFEDLASNAAALDTKNIFYRIKAIVDAGVDLGENVQDILNDTERNLTRLLAQTMLVVRAKEAVEEALAERRAKQREKEEAEARLAEARQQKEVAMKLEADILARSQALVLRGEALARDHREEAARQEAARKQAAHTTTLTEKGTARVQRNIQAAGASLRAEEIALDGLV